MIDHSDGGVGRRDARRLGGQRGGPRVERAGRLAGATTELAAAVAMLSEMGMAYWLPEAESELAQSDGSVPGEHVG